MYYYLSLDDKIEKGDKWTTDSHDGWFDCMQCVGFINKDYIHQYDPCDGWKVRRKIKVTKLGNQL